MECGSVEAGLQEGKIQEDGEIKERLAVVVVRRRIPRLRAPYTF
jgi:hypothetical protein